MKKTILLKMFTLIFIFFICYSNNSFSQSNRMDSLIYSKNLKIIDGSVPMYFAAQCENRAKKAQSLLEKLVENYSNDEKNVFNLKLAVIDSSQWSDFGVPYGLFFINQGWIIIPGDIDFNKFSILWGYYPFIDKVKNNISEISSNPEELITNTIYDFTICHELGHYYINNVVKANPPDSWSSEWMASYFAIDYFYKNKKDNLKALNIFQSTFTNEFEPKYRTIQELNTKYIGVGIQNYVWYHVTFLSMIQDIYSVYGTDFMQLFAEKFPPTEKPIKYSQEEILYKLDSITDGRCSKFANLMEKRPD